MTVHLKTPHLEPLLPPETEAQLTERQREILDILEELVLREELTELTMAQIASRASCSLRTLYGICPSRDELLLTVLDRRLHKIGRQGITGVDRSLPGLEAARRYLHAVNHAVQPSTSALSRQFARIEGAKPLLDSHESYVIAVTKGLLDRAQSEGTIGAVDTQAVASVLGKMGREFGRADTDLELSASPTETANALTDIVLAGLEASV
ncbi:MAG: TetR/AcrR family transcriptional regulator [Acidobacteriota bacterium]